MAQEKNGRGNTQLVLYAITVFILVVGIVMAAGSFTTRVDYQEKAIEEYDVRIKQVEEDTGDLKKDVQYIKEGIQRIEKKLDEE